LEGQWIEGKRRLQRWNIDKLAAITFDVVAVAIVMDVVVSS